MVAISTDLMRIADDLRASHDDVDAFLIDQIVARLIDRIFEAGA